jgi:hypothetical protein
MSNTPSSGFSFTVGPAPTLEQIQERYGLNPEQARVLLEDKDFVRYVMSSSLTTSSVVSLTTELSATAAKLEQLAKKVSP